MKGARSIEQLHHFRCGACGKWWSIGSAPPKRTKWFCPWCGKEMAMSGAKDTNKQSRKKK